MRAGLFLLAGIIVGSVEKEFGLNALGSIVKSFKIRKLQRKLTSISEFGGCRGAEGIEQMFGRLSKQDKALQRYLDFCVSDHNVHSVMRAYEIDRNDLEKIYSNLMANGAGQWVKGHFVPASSIAYAEPLTFILVANSIEVSDEDISPFELTALMIDYWGGKIPVGGLYRMMGMRS